LHGIGSRTYELPVSQKPAGRRPAVTFRSRRDDVTLAFTTQWLGPEHAVASDVRLSLALRTLGSSRTRRYGRRAGSELGRWSADRVGAPGSDWAAGVPAALVASWAGRPTLHNCER
jgi:hypothetical protein